MVYELDEEIWFPDPSLADPDGLLAMGGDLSIPRLLLAYSMGIFPWYSDGLPILWYAPHERFVLIPEELKISKSMRKIIRKSPFRITFNRDFNGVISQCASINRKQQDGTWITHDMKEAYLRLHEEGYALSMEVWEKENLVGGLYGVVCGKKRHIFCGESMFSLKPNTSKLALISLCRLGYFTLIDCQIESTHLKSLGAKMISSANYINALTL